MALRSPIVFASDFGPGSEWVGICHAVIAGIAPDAAIIDLVHSLEPFDVMGASQTLRDALPYAPPGFAVLVVDPGVGSKRRGVALRCGRGDVLVGPDNGLLPAAAEALGDIREARELSNKRLHSANASSTFHARDVFCPVAAHLAAGTPFAEVGSAFDPATLVESWRPRLELGAGWVRCDVTNIDRFGNVRLAARAVALRDAGLEKAARLWVAAPGGEVAARRVPTYAPLGAGEVGIVDDSFGWLCLCINRGSAAERLAVRRAWLVELRSHP